MLPLIADQIVSPLGPLNHILLLYSGQYSIIFACSVFVYGKDTVYLLESESGESC